MTSADRSHASDAPTEALDRVILGMVVSNGGDAAILHAQLAVIERALGRGRTWLEDSDPELARTLFPDLSVIEADPLAARTGSLTERLGYVQRAPFRVVAQPLARRVMPALLRRRRERRVDRAVARSRVVFHTGGTTLIEKYAIEEKLGHLVRAVRAGKTVVLLPQSLGPFRRPEHAVAVREIVEGAALVLLRDERSRQHLSDVGAPLERVAVVPDVVFTMTGAEDIESLATATIPEHSPHIAIGTRDCRNFFESGDPDTRQAALEQEYAGLATWLVRERDAQVTFVSTCQGIARYWTDDSEVAARVFDTLPADVQARCRVDREFHSTAELRALTRDFDLVVATRLHGAILALSAGVPVVPIEYEFKTRQVFRQLGQEDAVYSIENAGEHGLTEQVQHFIDGWPERTKEAAAGLRSVVESAWTAATLLSHAVQTASS